MAQPTLSLDQVQRIVDALSDPNRYEMLRRIYASDEAITCGCAKGDLAITDGTGSHHLKELLAADLVAMKPAGRQRLLSPRRDIWQAFLATLAAF